MQQFPPAEYNFYRGKFYFAKNVDILGGVVYNNSNDY